MTELSETPALVDTCSQCKKRVNLERHIKEINGKYYAICFDCSENNNE